MSYAKNYVMPHSDIDCAAAKRQDDIAMKYGIKEALKLDGVPSERTLRRHLKDGKIASEKDDNGHIKIAASELVRVYKIKVGTDDNVDDNGIAKKTAMPPHDTVNVTPEKPNKIIELQTKVDVLEQRIKDKDELISEYKNRITGMEAKEDKLLGIIEKQNALITYQPEKPQKQQPIKFHWGWGILAVFIAALLVFVGFKNGFI